MSRRFSINSLADVSDLSQIKQNVLRRDIQRFLSSATELLLHHVEDEIFKGCTDFSFYTGLVGVLMTLRRIKMEFNSDISIPVVSNVIKVRKNYLGFCSDMTWKMYLCLQNNREFELKREHYQAEDSANEMLYGKVGTLVLIDYFQSKGMQLFRADLVPELVASINIEEFPWRWNGKVYYGAAHGTAGILLTLTRIAGLNVSQHVKELIDVSHLPSGNFKSSSTSTSDDLVQWCHGAPGFVPLLLEYSDLHKEVLNHALQVIWTKGMLKKGHGICHGTAGNGYAFLSTFKKTRDDYRLFQSFVFANNICKTTPELACQAADRPYSLFEGLAGTVHFLLDIRKLMENNETFFESNLFDGLRIF
eukprot:gene4534-8999_t